MHTRRRVLAGLVAASAAPTLGWAAVGSPVAIGAARRGDGSHALIGLDATGQITFDIRLPGRGHAAAAHPGRAEAVAIARRPGTFARVIDCAAGTVLQTLSAPAGRHFFGHGAFSADGNLLFTTENDYATGRGVVGVWDRSLGYGRVGEFASGGIGPHEIIRLPDGTLAVANGGIRTHPDSGREKLNLDTMRSNLSILSPTGQVLDRAEVEEDTRLNSLRHIAAFDDGTVACGLQWQGDPFAPPPLLALYRPGKGLVAPQMDEFMPRLFDGYVGSVATSGPTSFTASSPRGGCVVEHDLTSGISKIHKATEVCGLSRMPGTGCLVTDGYGRVYRLTDRALARIGNHNLSFDNHLVAVRSGGEG